ncbi:MAG: Uma2 family endonuclease [Acidobacteria bacterium]|nr:Uma2 family endonuclease [Acidobacteriota bacterium]MBI3427549.1 Uma2 family endonuclease [Acidobacteriota bacterium]
MSTSPAKQTVTREIYYPETDGEPMAETDLHRNLILELYASLEAYYEVQTDVYVSSNLLIYYVQGDRKKRVAPDVFVVRGVPKHVRRIYKLWEEGRAPETVFEISSRGTILNDTQQKSTLYARWGVREYFLYDPEYDWLPEGLAAFRLVDGHYKEIEIENGVAHSETLGLDVVDTGETLRLREPRTGLFLPTRREEIAARQQAEAAQQQAEAAQQQAEAHAAAEAAARQQAEAELARLREDLARLRAQS